MQNLALSLFSAVLLSGCAAQSGLVAAGAPPPPPPPAANPEIAEFIPAPIISQWSIFNFIDVDPTPPYSYRRDIIFRSTDPRVYAITQIGGNEYYDLGQLQNGQMLGYARDSLQRIAVSRPLDRTMPWHRATPEATSGCRPAFEGFTNIFFDDNQPIAIGIWRSADDSLYRVAVYAQDFACSPSAVTDRRYTTVLTETTHWRLAEVRLQNGTVPSIRLLSDAPVGQSLHSSDIKLASHSWRGE